VCEETLKAGGEVRGRAGFGNADCLLSRLRATNVAVLCKTAFLIERHALPNAHPKRTHQKRL